MVIASHPDPRIGVRWAARSGGPRKDFDNDHAAAAARARQAMIGRGVWTDCVVCCLRRVLRDWGANELLGARDVGFAAGAGQQPVVADAVKPFWQNVEQEAPDELVGGEGHCAVPRPAVAAVILVPEGDAAVVERNEPAVRDGDAMRVAGEIGKHRFRPGERRLGVDVPCDRRSPGKEDGCNLKPFEAIQRVRLPPGRGAARQPEASLAREAATSLAKRRQRKLKPRVSLEIMYPLRPSVWFGRGRCRHDR
jgi:hypothetical protein